MKDGDVIMSVDGKQIEDTSDLLRTIAGKAPGNTVDLTLWRNGETVQVKVQLGERSSQAARQEPSARHNGAGQADVEQLGLTVRTLTPEERKRHAVPSGEGLMIVSVESDHAAQEADLRAGDIILQANMQSVGDVQTLAKIIKDQGLARGVLAVKIRRGSSTFFRTIQLKK